MNKEIKIGEIVDCENCGETMTITQLEIEEESFWCPSCRREMADEEGCDD